MTDPIFSVKKYAVAILVLAAFFIHSSRPFAQCQPGQMQVSFYAMGTTIQEWTVPTGVTSVTIFARGADGGNDPNYQGGSGAMANGTFTVAPGDVLDIHVGAAGADAIGGGGGGGGGTGIRDNTDMVLMVVGGGGGGGGESGTWGVGGLGGSGGGIGGFGGGGPGGESNGPGGGGGGGGIFGPGSNGEGNGGEGGGGGFGGTIGVGGGAGGSGTGAGGGSANSGGGGGGGYSGGNGGGNNGDAGGGSTFVTPDATSISTTAGVYGGGTGTFGSVTICYSVCSIMAMATATSETCGGGNDGTITVNATPINCSGSPEYSLDGGPFQAGNMFTGLAPGAYTVTVRCSTDPTCVNTAMATVDPGMGMCPTSSRTNPNDPSSFDPCSCGDPQNYYDGNGDITYFHDFVEVTSVTGEMWTVTAVMDAFTDNGVTPIVVTDPLTETAPGSGIYRIDLFHAPGVGFTMTVDRTGAPFPLMEGGTCTACKQIPTLGQWGLILLSLLILTFGVVALRRHEPVLAMAGQGSSSASNNRSLPFNKAAFGKMLVAVMLGLAATFAVAIAFFGYEMTTADVPGSLVTGPLLAYLLHLLVKKD